MSNLLHWLSKHKFQAYLLAFLLIALPPTGFFLDAHSPGWVIALLALVVSGNLLSILIR